MGYNFPTFLISFQAKKQYLVLLKNTMAISITNISILQYVLPGLCHHVCYVWRRSAFLIFFCSKLKKNIYILLEIPNSSLFFWRYIWYWYITPPPTDPNWTSSTRCQRLQMPEIEVPADLTKSSTTIPHRPLESACWSKTLFYWSLSTLPFSLNHGYDMNHKNTKGLVLWTNC